MGFREGVGQIDPPPAYPGFQVPSRDRVKNVFNLKKMKITDIRYCDALNYALCFFFAILLCEMTSEILTLN